MSTGEGSVECRHCGHDNRAGARYCDACGGALEVVDATTPPLVPGPVADGRYVPERLIGQGSRKLVYLATDERLGRDVALAIVRTEGLDRAARARLAREARAMARLGDHPRVVTVFDVGEQPDGTPYIVSQYMPGGSLADRLETAEGRRLPIDDVLVLGEQIADALAHAHAHGIVHRDLKPGNVWLAADGTARLGDFGLAAPVDASRVTSEGMLVGTVAYLAPEQALGRDPEPRADLYSLGALLYELLCGRPPFLGDDAVTVVSQHLHTAPVLPSWHREDVTVEIDDLIMALLAKDPDRRPATAAEVGASLARLQTSTSASPAPYPGDVQRPDLRRADWGRFVGRGEELAQLKVALDHALSGQARLVMVVGEPGIGKTRLVEELGTYASMRGAQVLWGHSYDGDLSVPYLPFVEALRAYVRAGGAALTTTSGGLPEVATLLPELREIHSALPILPALDDDAERLRLFEGVTAFLRSAAQIQPLVLVLDDLHWADKPSLRLLQHVVRSTEDQRLLLLGTYRDIELDRNHPLAETMTSLRRSRAYERVLVRGLPPTEVKALVEAISGQDVEDRFAELLFRETEGNPFFIAEILRHLVETGAIRREGGRFVGTPEIVASAIPEGVREVIGRRLDTLSARCNEMLAIAAAMPSGFGVDIVGAVLGASDDEMLDLLDDALAAQVVRERRDQPGAYEFAHALIRQTLYGELSTPRRVRVHRRIVEALEATFRDRLDTHLTELAFHAFQSAPGGDTAKAVDYATRAGDKAMERAAYEEAVRSYEMALQVIEPDIESAVGPVQATPELLLRLGRARHRAGDSAGGRSAHDEAIGIARRVGDACLLARIAIEYHGTASAAVSSGLEPSRLELYAEAEKALRGVDPTAEHLALLAEVLGLHASYTSVVDPSGGEALAVESIEVARRSGSPTSLAAGLRAVAPFLNVRGELGNMDEIEALVDELPSPDGRLSLIVVLVTSAWIAGERAAYDHWLDRCVTATAATRAAGRIAAASQMQASREVVSGRLQEGERLLRSSLEAARRLEDRALFTNVGVGLWPIYREQGRMRELERPTRAIALAPDAIVSWHLALAHLLAEIGGLDEACVVADDCIERVRSGVPITTTRRYILAGLGDIAWRSGRRHIAEAALEVAGSEPVRGLCGVGTSCHGAAVRAVALAHEVLGDVESAARLHEEALALHESFQAPIWAARSRFDLARTLTMRDGPGDNQRAVGLVNHAIEEASEFDARRLVEDALALKLAMQGVDSGSSPALSIDAISASITVDRPDLRGHAAADGNVTFCFSDVVDYSVITDRLGDQRTHALLSTHNELLRAALGRHRGTEVKSEGDGFMLVFTDPADALRFAADFQRAVASHSWPTEVARLQVRIGLHLGQAIRDQDDFYGRTVIIGARINGHARPGEVLVSDEVRRAVAGFEFAEPHDVTLKGLSGTQRVHRFVWDR